MEPLLEQVDIIVRDMDAAVAFYELLGVEVPTATPDWNAHHRAAKTTGGADIDFDSAAFAAQWNESWPADAGGVLLTFRTRDRDDVDAIYEKLTGAGYRSQQAPYDPGWGARFAVVTDPDGNAVALMSPVDPAKRSPMSPPA